MAHQKLSEPVIYAKAQWIAAQTDLPLNMRRDLLNTVLRLWTDAWRIIGITDKALEVYARRGFHRHPTREGLQRAHIRSRRESYDELLVDLPPENEFFAYLREHDRTVLCAAGKPHSEGRLVERGEITWHPVPEGLFPSDYISWLHRQQEAEFLRSLHEKVTA